LFAANLKNALRRCLGITSRKRVNNREETRDWQRRRQHGKDNRTGYNKNKNNTGLRTHGKDINSFKEDLIKFLTNYKV
jgi:hypothetical protein